MFVYRVKTRWSFEFVKVEAEKVTAASVFIKGSRAARSSDGVRYFDDFDSARDYAVERLKITVDNSRKEMEKALSHLRSLLCLTDETIRTTDF